jgi:TPR repeat protein
LKDGGFVTQWLPLYQVSPKIGLSMVRAFLDVFPDAVLLSGMTKEMILVGRAGARSVIDPGLLARNLAAAPAVQADLARIQMGSLTDMIGSFVANGQDLRRATRHAAPVTDDNRAMEYGMLSKFSDTGPAPELFRVDGVAAWCPDCFENGRPSACVPWLERYLAALGQLYRSDAFLFFRSAWGSMGSSDIDLADRDGSLGTVISRFPYLERVLASPLTGSLEKVVRREGPWSLRDADEASIPDAAAAIRVAMKRLRAGRLPEALAWFKKAVELDETDVSARFGLGYALFYGGDLKGAAEQYRSGLRSAPENATAWLSLASVLRRAGLERYEMEALKRVLLLRPGCAPASERLGRLLKK